MIIVPEKVRAWCRARGVAVAPGGVLHADVLARYTADTVVITCPVHWVDRDVHPDGEDSGCPRCTRRTR